MSYITCQIMNEKVNFIYILSFKYMANLKEIKKKHSLVALPSVFTLNLSSLSPSVAKIKGKLKQLFVKLTLLVLHNIYALIIVQIMYTY